MFKTVQDVNRAIAKAERNYYRRMSKHNWFDPKERPFKLGMTLLKRTGTFKQSNDKCTFDPIAMRAYSYGWWRFVDRVDGLIVFNNCGYSSTTTQHQYKVANLLRDLGVKVDVEVEVPKGLQNLDSGIAMYERRIQELVSLIQKPRSRKATNEARVALVREYQGKIATLNKLIAAQEKV